MSILKVARMGHPVLREVADEVDPTTVRSPAFQRLIDDMIETMVEYHGVGLAAPQVHASLRVFVAHLDTDGRAESEPIAIVNPEIEVVGDVIVEGWEGCLSIPDIRGQVPRAREITVRGMDRKGSAFELRFQDFPARVIQHETDHLDGILFFDRMRSFDTLTYLDEYGRYWAKD
jgi:peptide deformylase